MRDAKYVPVAPYRGCAFTWERVRTAHNCGWPKRTRKPQRLETQRAAHGGKQSFELPP